MGDVSRYNMLYAQFHALLVRLSENPLLLNMVERLNIYVFRQQLSNLIDLQLVRASHIEHEALLEAILTNKPDEAETAVRKHISHFTDHIRSLPGSYFKI